MDKRIIYAVGAGAVGYLIYNQFKKKSSTAVETKEESKDTPATPNTNPNTNAGVVKSEYEKKVMDLQGLLKVGTDGVAGKATNGALENLWSATAQSVDSGTAFNNGYPNLKKNGKGVVSASNVDYYISTINAKNTPSQLFYKKKATSTATAKVVGDAAKIRDAYKKAGILKSIRTTKYNEVVQDAARGVWMTTGKSVENGANNAFTFPEFSSRGNVKVVAITKSGNLIVSVYALTLSKGLGTTFYSVPASSVYVEQ
jgi:hypothetical protein